MEWSKCFSLVLMIEACHKENASFEWVHQEGWGGGLRKGGAGAPGGVERVQQEGWSGCTRRGGSGCTRRGGAGAPGGVERVLEWIIPVSI